MSNTTANKKNTSLRTILDNKKFLRVKDVISIYSISRTTVFRWISEGKLPQPKRITARVIGWDRDVLDKIFLDDK